MAFKDAHIRQVKRHHYPTMAHSLLRNTLRVLIRHCDKERKATFTEHLAYYNAIVNMIPDSYYFPAMFSGVPSVVSPTLQSDRFHT